MPAFRSVVFDMDGLMFNTEEIYTMVGERLLGRWGLEFTGELKDAMMGLPPRPTFELMIRWHHLDTTWEELAGESNEIFLSLLDAHLTPMPGLLDLLGILDSAKIPMAIATSSARELFDAVFRRCDLRDRFQFVLTSEDIVEGKPHPEIYLTAAKRFGIHPREMLVLEDSQNGCRAAAAAGAFVVAVPGEHSRRHDFSTASLVVDSLADVRLFEALGIRG